MEGLADPVCASQSYNETKDEQMEVGRDLTEKSSHSQIENANAELDHDVKAVRGINGLHYVPDSVLCNFCWKYVRSEVLTDHIAACHTGVNLNHVCKDCGKSYRFASTLAHHRSKCHNEAFQSSPQDSIMVSSQSSSEAKPQFTCIICQKTFDIKCRLMKHMMGHHKTWSFVYRCVICLEQFDAMSGLQEHAESHAGDGFDCSLCGLQLKGADEISKHTESHRELEQTILSANKTKRKYNCKAAAKDCGASRKHCDGVCTDSQDGVISKKDDGVNRDRLRCDICGDIFHFASTLISHMKLHQDSQSLKCHRCFQMYCGIQALRIHLESCDAPNPEADPPGVIPKRKRHKCDLCNEKFLTYNRCQSHRLIHTGEPKPHQCPVCGKRFLLRAQLRKHSGHHMEVSPHVCEFCGRGFAMRQSLRYHRMKHTGDKPCLCDICGKRFVSTKKLRLHTFVHTRETPFNCKVCGRGFRAFVTRQKHKCEGPPAEAPSEPQDSIDVKSETNSPMVNEINMPKEGVNDGLDSLAE